MFKPFDFERDEPCRGDGVSLILLQAAALIREHGWCRGEFINHAGRLCLHGAINMAVTGHAEMHSVPRIQFALARLYHHLRSTGAHEGLHLRYDGYSLTEWNDHHARTAAEVIAALEAAAAEPVTTPSSRSSISFMGLGKFAAATAVSLALTACTLEHDVYSPMPDMIVSQQQLAADTHTCRHAASVEYLAGGHGAIPVVALGLAAKAVQNDPSPIPSYALSSGLDGMIQACMVQKGYTGTSVN